MSFNNTKKLSEVSTVGHYVVTKIKPMTTNYGPTNILICDHYPGYCELTKQLGKTKRGIEIWANTKLNEAVKKAEKQNKIIKFDIRGEYETKYGSTGVNVNIAYHKKPIEVPIPKTEPDSETEAPISNFVI
jgi:hypothetical protein